MGKKGGGRKGGHRARHNHHHPHHNHHSHHHGIGHHHHHGIGHRIGHHHHGNHFHHGIFHSYHKHRRHHFGRRNHLALMVDPFAIFGNGIANNPAVTSDPATYSSLMVMGLTLNAHGMGNYSSLTDEEKASKESELTGKLEARVVESVRYRESIINGGRLIDENTGALCDKIFQHQTYIKKEDEILAKAIGDGRLAFLKDYQKEVQMVLPSTAQNPMPSRKIQLCNEKWEDCQVKAPFLCQFRLPGYMKGIQGKCLTCNSDFAFGTNVKGHVIYFQDDDLNPVGERVITGVLVKGEIVSPDNSIVIEGVSFSLLETEGFAHHETTAPINCCCSIQ